MIWIVDESVSPLQLPVPTSMVIGGEIPLATNQQECFLVDDYDNDGCGRKRVFLLNQI